MIFNLQVIVFIVAFAGHRLATAKKLVRSKPFTETVEVSSDGSVSVLARADKDSVDSANAVSSKSANIASCSAGTTLTGCTCHSQWGSCDGARITGNKCKAYKKAGGKSVVAHAVCVSFPEGSSSWQDVLSKKSDTGDNAETKASCPVGKTLTGCSCYSFQKSGSCGGAKSQGNICTAYNKDEGKGVYAQARCGIVPGSFNWQDVLSKKSAKSKSAQASCPAGKTLTGCSCYSPWGGCGGAKATGNACLAMNNGAGNSVHAQARCADIKAATPDPTPAPTEASTLKAAATPAPTQAPTLDPTPAPTQATTPASTKADQAQAAAREVREKAGVIAKAAKKQKAKDAKKAAAATRRRRRRRRRRSPGKGVANKGLSKKTSSEPVKDKPSKKVPPQTQSTGFVECAVEGGVCGCEDGVVLYGHHDRGMWLQKRVDGTILCNAQSFRGTQPERTLLETASIATEAAPTPPAKCRCFSLGWCDANQPGEVAEERDAIHRRRDSRGHVGSNMYQRRRWCGWGPVDCRLSKWTPWSWCAKEKSAQCKDGKQTRTRTKVHGNANGGKCGALTETRSCMACQSSPRPTPQPTAQQPLRPTATPQPTAASLSSKWSEALSGKSGTTDGASTEAACPEGTTLTSCSCYSPDGSCDGAKAKGNLCSAYNKKSGLGVYAQARCGVLPGSSGWQDVMSKKSDTTDNAETKASCPDGLTLTGCSCYSPWASCDGAKSKGNSCTAYNINEGKGVYAQARCGVVPGSSSWQDVLSSKSDKSDGARTEATCPAGTLLTGCSCYSPWGACGGAKANGSTCVANNNNAGSGVYAQARCGVIQARPQSLAVTSNFIECAKEGQTCNCRDGVVLHGHKDTGRWMSKRVDERILCAASEFVGEEGDDTHIAAANSNEAVGQCRCFNLKWCESAPHDVKHSTQDVGHRRREAFGSMGENLWQRRRWCGLGPRDCVFAKWTSWSACKGALSCGSGFQVRNRKKVSEAANGGSCDGDTHTRKCDLGKCVPARTRVSGQLDQSIAEEAAKRPTITFQLDQSIAEEE